MWMNNVNVRPKNIKFLEEIARESFIIFGNDFLGVTSEVQATKVKIGKSDCIKMETFVPKKNSMNNGNIMDKIYATNDKMIIFLVCGKIINVK